MNLATYDETEIKARLARLDRSRRTVFAAACAERLLPLFGRYTRATGQGDIEGLKDVLALVWSVAGGEERGGLAEAQDIAEGMVPSDDGEWSFEMGYGQNAAAAAAYAVRTWLTDDPQEAVWGARQVYEAADYAAQRSLSVLNLNESGTEERLLQDPAVQMALAGLAADLTGVESTGDWTGLRQRARDEGEAWVRTLP